MLNAIANKKIIRYLPLWLHIVTYTLTCLIAAIFFYFGYQPILVPLEYFSGVAIPSSFSLEQHIRFIALFLGAPALFILGYWMAARIKTPVSLAVLQGITSKFEQRARHWLSLLFFCVSVSVGMYDLTRLKAFSEFHSYWDHFSILGHFGFVNLYLLIPLFAAWVILSCQDVGGASRRVMQWITMGIVLALTCFLFRKKALIIVFLTFTFGYLILVQRKTKIVNALCRVITSNCAQRVSLWLPILVFCVSVSVGTYDLIRAGVFSKLLAWADYGHWVQARWELFANLGFFNFVNIYLIGPMSAAWVILSVQETGMKRQVVRWGSIAIVLALNFLLFQKKALLVALIIIFGAMLVHRLLREGWRKSLTVLFLVGSVLLAVAYFLMLLSSVLSETSKTADEVLKPVAKQSQNERQVEALKTVDGVPKTVRQQNIITRQKEKNRRQTGVKTVQKTLKKPIARQSSIVQQKVDNRRYTSDKTADETVESVIQQDNSAQEKEKKRRTATEAMALLFGHSHKLRLALYSLLAPLTRTSAPAMYYPIVFPEHHSFFGLDLGQDILGWGNMPDDNRVVWKYMFPDLPGGSVMVPFQFVLYSQVGTVFTLVLSLLLGGALGILWQGILIGGDGNRVWRSLMGSMLLLFSIYLAGDSVRSSLVVSYGVLWGCLFTFFFFVLSRLLSHVNHRSRANRQVFRLFKFIGTRREADSSKP